MPSAPLPSAIWINASNEVLLRRHGVTAGKNKVSRGLAALYEREIAHQLDMGKSDKDARAHVSSEYICQNETRKGIRVYAIRADKLDLLRDWIDNEYRWISVNNYERMKALGFTNGVEVLTTSISRLHGRALKDKLREGLPPRQVREFVECHWFRLGRSEQGREVWQIHEAAVDQLKEYLAEQNPWINSHNRTELKRYGITAKSTEIDAILGKFFTRLVEQHKDSLASSQAAVAFVKENLLRPGESRYGLHSVDIKRTYLTQLLQDCPELGRRAGGEWLSSVSLRLKAKGAQGARSTIERAMEMLRDRSVEALIQSGLSHDEAVDRVAQTIVNTLPGLHGILTLKIHTDHVDELIQIIQQMPHYASYKARTKKKSCSENTP